MVQEELPMMLVSRVIVVGGAEYPSTAEKRDYILMKFVEKVS